MGAFRLRCHIICIIAVVYLFLFGLVVLDWCLNITLASSSDTFFVRRVDGWEGEVAAVRWAALPALVF